MQRICFVMQVRPDLVQEYRERHETVWPDMQDALRASGWGDYTLFLAPDGLLVGFLQTEDFDAARAAMAGQEVNRRWQQEMAGFFQDLDGRPPDAAMTPLTEIFHLD